MDLLIPLDYGSERFYELVSFLTRRVLRVVTSKTFIRQLLKEGPINYFSRESNCRAGRGPADDGKVASARRLKIENSNERYANRVNNEILDTF